MARRKVEPMPVQPCLAPELHDSLVICLPLPPVTLSPNSNSTRPTSWGAAMGLKTAREKYRKACVERVLFEVDRMGWVAPQRARIHIVFGYRHDRAMERALPKSRKSYRASDVDNGISSIKMAFDALTRGTLDNPGGGAIVDDDWKHMELGSVRMDDEEGPHLRVEVEALER